MGNVEFDCAVNLFCKMAMLIRRTLPVVPRCTMVPIAASARRSFAIQPTVDAAYDTTGMKFFAPDTVEKDVLKHVYEVQGKLNSLAGTEYNLSAEEKAQVSDFVKVVQKRDGLEDLKFSAPDSI